MKTLLLGFTLCLTLCCCTLQNSIAQTLKGTVKSASGEGLASARVVILNSSKGAITDNNGAFAIDNVPQGKQTLSVSRLGYAVQTLSVAITAEGASVNITLRERSTTLDELVVSAEKREQRLVDAPVAVSSVSAKKIEDTRTVNLSNLTGLVPNYLYQELGVGFQQIQSIRGIQVFSENPAVATYIDDVNNLDILANGMMLTDIERIEILRGPQGTLFGRNAMGGVINIITQKPTNRTQGFAEVEFGNLAQQRFSAGFKTPLVKDVLFFGVNALYNSRDGFWKNDTTGTGATDGSIVGKTVGGEKNLYGNLWLQWLPSANFTATLNVKAQRDWSDNTGFFVSQRSETVAFANPDKINLARIGSHERNIINAALTLKYFGEGFTLTSISALQTISLSFKDIDFPGFYHSFISKQIGEFLPPQQVWSEELRIQSTGYTRFQYTAGVFGFTQQGYEPSTNLAFEVAPNAFSIFRNKSNNLGLAAFGEASYAITDELKITAGLRFDYERPEATFNGFGDASFAGGVFTQRKPDTTVSGTYTALSPKLALSYKLGESSTVYGSFTRGFRAGGVNAQKLPNGIRQTFDPEYSNNYELGYKIQTTDNKLSIGAAAYLIQWQNLQFFNLVAPFTYARENVGDARSLGVEVEATAIPLTGLQLDASVGVASTAYQDFTLKRVSFVTGQESTTAIGGKRLSNAPASTIFVAAQYTIPFAQDFSASIRGEVRNIGEFYTDIQNTLLQPAYTLVNARLVLAYTSFSLAFWGQNLTDTRYLAFGNPDTSFGRSVRTAAPRTFGVTLSAKF
jgi:iron complex outermembrane receptor protein